MKNYSYVMWPFPTRLSNLFSLFLILFFFLQYVIIINELKSPRSNLLISLLFNILHVYFNSGQINWWFWQLWRLGCWLSLAVEMKIEQFSGRHQVWTEFAPVTYNNEKKNNIRDIYSHTPPFCFNHILAAKFLTQHL